MTHRPENARKKKYTRGLDNSGNIEGIFIFRLPGSLRDSRVREASEGASVKADEGVD
jgi:hypothetical protein